MTHRITVRPIGADLVVPVVSFVLGVAALTISAQSNGNALVWPTAGFIIIMAIMARDSGAAIRRVILGVLGAVAADYLVNSHGLLSMGFALACLTECVIVVAALRPISGLKLGSTEPGPQVIWRLGAVLIGPAAAACIASAAIWSCHGGATLSTAVNWFLADLLGILILLPLAFTKRDETRRRSVLRVLVIGLGILVAMTLCVLSIRSGSWLFWAMAFPIGGVVTYYGGVAIAQLFIIAMLILPVVGLGQGWFMSGAGSSALTASITGEILLDLQIFVVMMASSTMLVAATARAEKIARHDMNQALEHARAEAAMNRKLVDALDRLKDGFAMYDADDRLVMFNERYREIYPESAPAMHPGAHFEDILRFALKNGQIRGAVGREEEWLKERLALHLTREGAMEQQMPDGRWLLVHETRTEDGGRIGFRIDVSQRKALEAQLLAALEQAERSNLARDTFLANMSHELRTPLNAVIGFAQLVSQLSGKPESAGKVREYGDDIAWAGRRLLKMIEDLLTLSHRGMALSAEIEAYEPAEVLKAAYRLTGKLAMNAGKTLTLENTAGDAWMLADAGKLEQILVNLVGNAIKYSGDSKYIELRAEASEDHVILRVVDHGPGVPEEHRRKIFDRFERLNAGDRGLEGAGIGLSLSKDMAASMDATLDVEATPGGGATFVVTLKRAESAHIAYAPDRTMEAV